MTGRAAVAAALLLLATGLWPARTAPAGQPPRRPGAAPAEGAGRLVDGLLRRLVARCRPAGRASGDWVADLGEVVAVGLRAGLDLPAAVRVGARTPAVLQAAPWLGAALEVGADGSGPVLHRAALARHAGAASPDLLVLARAWQLSERTGAAAAHTTAAAAAAIRARSAARHRTDVALAGPQASMRLLCALPVAGPVVGLLVGLDPRAVYASNASWLAAGAGLALTALGWWWSSAIVRRAHRPATTDIRP